MIGRAALALLLAALGLLPIPSAAGPPARNARIGYLATSLAGQAHLHQAFVQGLRDLGHVEGRNVAVEYRDAAGRTDRFPALAAELVALKVDVIVAPTTLAALAARHATATIPIVFATAGDPVSSGLVASLARPGGNVTGSSILAPDLVAKRLELLRQAVPGISRIGVLWQPGSMGDRMDRDMLREVESAARALGLRLHPVEARRAADLEGAFRDLGRAGAEAVTVFGATTFVAERRRLVELASRHRLPAIYTSREFADAGGLLSYGPNLAAMYRRAAAYVDRILRGASPADLPVEQPTTFELIINRTTARALGLAIPESLLRQADQLVD